MKTLFFLLLALNLVFFAWQYYHRNDPLAVALPSDAQEGIPTLVLLSEREVIPQSSEKLAQDTLESETLTEETEENDVAEEKPAIADTPALASQSASELRDRRSIGRDPSFLASTEQTLPADLFRENSAHDGASDLTAGPEALAPELVPPTVVPALSSEDPARLPICRTLGPIETEQQAEKFAVALADQVSRVRRREEKNTKIDSYWVLAPPQGTRAETRRVVANLKKSGVKDLWIMPKGEFKGYISLGIYAREARTKRRRAQLAAHGLETNVRPRFNEQPRFWLDLEISAEGLDDDALAQSVEQMQPALSLVPLDCREIAID